jgi:hypothetical protein
VGVKENMEHKLNKLNKPNKLTLVFIALWIICIPSISNADLEDILLRFQPYITVQEEYDSNINLTPTNRKEDFITTVYPGLKFSTLPRSATIGQVQRVPTTAEENYGIDLDYRLGLVFYAKEDNNNYISHEGTFNAWYTFDRRLTLRLRDYLIRSEEPREREFTPEALPNQYLLGTQRERSTYLRNVAEPSITYQFGKEDHFDLGYRSNIYKNHSSLIQDSREDYINPKLTYWLNIRNGVSLEYGLTLGDFERSPDILGHMARGRYTYRFNPRTSIFGEYTFLKRDFESPSIDYDVHTPTLGIEHALSPTLTSRVQVGYFWQNPDRGSSTNGPFYDVSLTQRAEKTTYVLYFQGGYTEDYFTAENLGFTKYYRAIGTITHQLMERMTLGLSGTGERAKYVSDRKDWIWGISGNASYALLKWLSISLESSYQEDHSNIDQFDYKDYREIFRITATF